MYRRGFTLIEILMVCAIIGLLSALLFVVFSSSRRASHETVCLSQMRQIGLAIKMYEQDFGEIPPTLKPLRPSYITQRDLLFCPVFQMLVSDAPPDKQAQYDAVPDSYAYQPEETAFWVGLPSEQGDSPCLKATWKEGVEKRGERVPLLLCSYHDPARFKPELSIMDNGNIRNIRLVLRADGSVRKRTAEYSGRGTSFCWYDW